MGVFKNFIEPAGLYLLPVSAVYAGSYLTPVNYAKSSRPAIVTAFTTGAIVNRRHRVRQPDIPSVESPLLPDPEYVRPVGEDNAVQSAGHSRTIQSRILARFPFLIEIWYWLFIYWIYQGARAISARAISGQKVVFDRAELHARQILALEHALHIDVELAVQRYVLSEPPWLVPFLARVYYSHIIVGVVFYVYSYTFMKRDKYQGIRRTMALENVLAFAVITLWRCMPPRLLPEEFGFIDVLHSNKGGSTWTQNRFQLTIAAMPSLHFGNSMFIALCLVKFSPHWFLRVIAPLWPMLMALTIVATANHFILDAVAGACLVLFAYRYNHVMLRLLPVERVLLRLLRLEKP